MSHATRAILALGLAVILSGCFKSDYPLITVFDSVAPIPEGTYTYVDVDGKEKHAVITTELTVTKMITVGSDGVPKLQYLLMRDLGEGYYIAMDGERNYALLQVGDGEVLEFDERRYCDDLKEIAEQGSGSLADYHTTSNGADENAICKFSSYDDLAHAFETLDVFNALDVVRDYHRS